MSQLPLFQPAAWSVSDITRHITRVLEADAKLQDVWVQGEVSNCKRPGSGHLYFTLKDRGASLGCVMWRNTVIRQKFIPRDGDAVEVHGGISVFEANGVYQLYADQIRPTGEGILYQEYLRTKARLEAEGLFSPERKRPIPVWPNRIGIVTSPTGAALRDMLDTIRRRYPTVEIILSATQVQGEEAPFGIVAALRAFENDIRPDVILLARGGGSIEDLWAFNQEIVARAIADCTCPVICGVGHETDFTIADFAADLRAATPTAAAELATPDQEELRSELAELSQRLKISMRSCLTMPRWLLNDLQRRMQIHSPRDRLRSDRQRLDELEHRTASAAGHLLDLERAHLMGLEQRLAALNPLSILSRGFAIVTDEHGKLIKSTRQITKDQNLSVRVSDGKFGVKVKSNKE